MKLFDIDGTTILPNFAIRVAHLRDGRNHPYKTIVEFEDKERGLLLTARSTCSENDQFCKKTGRLIAARRLHEQLKGLEIDPKIQKLAFWTIVPEVDPRNKKQKKNSVPESW